MCLQWFLRQQSFKWQLAKPLPAPSHQTCISWILNAARVWLSVRITWLPKCLVFLVLSGECVCVCVVGCHRKVFELRGFQPQHDFSSCSLLEQAQWRRNNTCRRLRVSKTPSWDNRGGISIKLMCCCFQAFLTGDVFSSKGMYLTEI